MSDISNNNNDVLGYVITYTLSTKIQCLSLPTPSDVEFIKSNGSSYVSGLKITVSKSNMSDALKDSRIIAEKIVGFISFRDGQHLTIVLSGCSGIPKVGKTARVSKSMTYLFNIKAPEPVLELSNQDLIDGLNISKLDLSLLQRFNSAISHYKSGSSIEALKLLFAIIENDEGFPNYNKYSALRNIFTHSPDLNRPKQQYHPETIKNFTNYFDESDFDYLQFEPHNNIIILDVNSQRNLKRLHKIVSDLIQEMELYIKQKLNFR